MSTKPLVLITGATGHIGYRVLAFALESGYRCRITSRSLSSLERLKSLTSTAPYFGTTPTNNNTTPGASDIEFVVVSDILVPGAFDDAVKGVDFVIHLAAPIPTPEAMGKHWKEFFYEPAVRGTVGILESAAKSPSVKRVVITSSTAAVGGKEGEVGGIENLLPKIDEDVDPGNEFVAYKGSKILAHWAGTEWMEKHEEVKFDLVRILPPYVQGRHEVARTLRELGGGSNEAIVGLVEGRRSEVPKRSATVFVDDVAKVHVWALDGDKVKGGEQLLVAGEAVEWDDVTEIVKRRFKEEVESGFLPMGGKQKSSKIGHDSSRVKEVFGLEFVGLEEQVVDVVKQYIELKKSRWGVFWCKTVEQKV
jgi:nucleoside-diphosphate-sugar epimerase